MRVKWLVCVHRLIYIAVTVPTSENISQGVQGKCKSEFAKSNTCTYAHAEERGKTHLSPLYTHNALKWKTSHTGLSIEGGGGVGLIFVFLSPVVSSLPVTKFIIISASESSTAFGIYNHPGFNSFSLATVTYRPAPLLTPLLCRCTGFQSHKSASQPDCLCMSGVNKDRPAKVQRLFMEFYLQSPK